MPLLTPAWGFCAAWVGGCSRSQWSGSLHARFARTTSPPPLPCGAGTARARHWASGTGRSWDPSGMCAVRCAGCGGGAAGCDQLRLFLPAAAVARPAAPLQTALAFLKRTPRRLRGCLRHPPLARGWPLTRCLLNWPRKGRGLVCPLPSTLVSLAIQSPKAGQLSPHGRPLTRCLSK